MILNLPIFKDPKVVGSLLALVCVASLGMAYVSEKFFGLHPCVLCLYQRYVYMAVLVLAVVSILLKSRYIIFLCSLGFLVGAGIAFYQVGVEQHIFQLPDVCKAGLSSMNAVDLKEQLMQKPVIPCDKVEFELFGISMAGYNGLFSMALFLYSWIAFRKGDS